MPEQNVRSFLEERKAEYIAELRQLAPELAAKLLGVIAAIDALDSTAKEAEVAAVDDYASIRKPIDAIESYLDKTGKPAPRELIARTLEEGGWGKGRVARPYWNLLSILDYHLKLTLKSEPRLKEIGGLVGRVEWPDDAFRQDAV